jgi:peroxiredoxin family protein
MEEKKLAIIATKGSLDWAYPPFILASTASALGYETQIFFTFYGLQLLKKKLALEVTPLGNPGMPMPMGMDKWFPVLGLTLPGMQGMMTSMMKKKMKDKGVASVEELRDLCQEAEVKLIACQMTVDLFDMNPSRVHRRDRVCGRLVLLRVRGRKRHLSLYLKRAPRTRRGSACWACPGDATAESRVCSDETPPQGGVHRMVSAESCPRQRRIFGCPRRSDGFRGLRLFPPASGSAALGDAMLTSECVQG